MTHLGSHVDTFLGNLDLLILATPLVRKHSFRDLDKVGICSFQWLFQRWFQEGFQRRTFRDLDEFRCQMGAHFGLTWGHFLSFLRSPAQDGSQGVPGQAPRLQIVPK